MAMRKIRITDNPSALPDALKIQSLEDFNAFLSDIKGERMSPELRVSALARLRELTEAGDVKVSEFLNAGEKVGKMLSQDFRAFGAGSSRGTGVANAFESQSGFRFKDAGTGAVEIQSELFGSDFQRRFREEILPDDLPEDQREAFLSQIPSDIPIESDRFAVEREGIRQAMQAQAAEAEAATTRESRLADLAALLQQQEESTFARLTPQLAEQAQAQGLFETSAFGESLARERTALAEQTQQALALQGLSDRDAEILGQLRADAIQRGFQTGGLQRQFGLEDISSDFQRQLQIAALTQPQTGGGKSSGEKWAQGASAVGGLLGGIGSMTGRPKTTGN